MANSERIVDIQVRWGDADAFGHVNNVVFFRYLEEARARVIPSSGPGSTILSGGLVVAEQRLRYLAPIHYREEPIQVGMTVAHVGGSSFHLACRVFDSKKKLVFADGLVALVTYSFAKGRPRKLSKEERAWLSGD